MAGQHVPAIPAARAASTTMRNEHDMAVGVDGECIIVETAFGTARFDVSNDVERANEQLRNHTWDEMTQHERRCVLVAEVETALSYHRLGEL